ncbi:MAG: antitoxin Xre/MbcA/ParS toxin-binding domain-containing protein [Sumerlaeia bacterium]
MTTATKKKSAPLLKDSNASSMISIYTSASSSETKNHREILPSVLISRVRKGLAISELEELHKALEVPMEKLAPMIGVSLSTLHRRKAEKNLSTAESERVVRFARLYGKAVDVLETTENARLWLKSPQVGLSGETPLDYALTEIGAREVEDLLGRIQYGVYS